MILPQINRGWKTPEPEPWMLSAIVVIAALICGYSTARAAEPNAWKEPPKADAKIACKHGATVVPCELIPSVTLDVIEARNAYLADALRREVKSHNTTLGLLAQANERAARAEALRDHYAGLVSNVPAWVWWTAVGMSAALSSAATAWVLLR